MRPAANLATLMCCKAGRMDDERALVLRLPWQQVERRRKEPDDPAAKVSRMLKAVERLCKTPERKGHRRSSSQ